MKLLSAGVTYVCFATLAALLLGVAAGGLGGWTAATSLTVGAIAAAIAYLLSADAGATPVTRETGPEYARLGVWLMSACFAIFALRSFCWLLYVDGNEVKVQSPNNLGDIALHITYIKQFASGAPLWPDNPIFVGSKLRYPAGVDLFTALFTCLHFDLSRTLIWSGLLASVATCYALARWGGVFGIAGFLFNGGLAGFQFFHGFHFMDYQGDKSIAWKSIPLAMFVTQRGFLYAIPAGLLLLCHWRSRFFPASLENSAETTTQKSILPFWIELSIYATLPLFHVHTFLALSFVLATCLVLCDGDTRKHITVLFGAAIVPATLFVWLITDHFQARSILKWNPGWVQQSGDFAAPFFTFWLLNFGVALPLAMLLVVVCIQRSHTKEAPLGLSPRPSLVFVLAAAAVFLLAILVKTAPWEWDNTKLIVWAYFIVLPFLWSELMARWPVPVRATLCLALFTSGFVSLIGGLGAGRGGFGIVDRAQMEGVAMAVRKLPVDARFAAFPTYNHPLLLAGRKVVLGYPGHLWTQGFDYSSRMEELTALMNGAASWRAAARDLQTHYVFWGPDEKSNYASSTRPWEHESELVATGPWGAIYDISVTAGGASVR